MISFDFFFFFPHPIYYLEKLLSREVLDKYEFFESSTTTVTDVLLNYRYFTPFLFALVWTLAPVVDRSWCRCRFHPLPGAASSFSDM